MELKQYFRVVMKKWWLVLLLVLLACTASGIKSYFYTTPVYVASAKLIVNQSPSSSNEQSFPSVGVLETNLMLMNSYKEIITSSAILDKVVERYHDLEDSANVMADTLKVSSNNDSQVLNLYYWSTSYESAAKTVNAISQVFKEQIPHIMNVDNITILNEAKLDNGISHKPVNINPVMSVVLAFVLSLLVSIGLVLCLHFLDDTVKNEEELKELLGIPLLAAMSRMKKEDYVKGQHENLNIPKAGEGNYVSVNQ